MDKSENRLKYKIEDKIGILGGTFDPPHKGHLKISQLAKKKFNLKKVIWAITKKNPFKTKSYFYLNKRIKLSRNLTKNQIKHFKDKNKKREIYFLLGADNLINFHKWNNWRKIPKFCKIVVFDRKSFKTKAKRSLAYKSLKNKGLIYINFKKINISSSKIRNFWYDQ